jgi:hypothetical protein
MTMRVEKSTVEQVKRKLEEVKVTELAVDRRGSGVHARSCRLLKT